MKIPFLDLSYDDLIDLTKILKFLSAEGKLNKEQIYAVAEKFKSPINTSLGELAKAYDFVLNYSTTIKIVEDMVVFLHTFLYSPDILESLSSQNCIENILAHVNSLAIILNIHFAKEVSPAAMFENVPKGCVKIWFKSMIVIADANNLRKSFTTRLDYQQVKIARLILHAYQNSLVSYTEEKKKFDLVLKNSGFTMDEIIHTIKSQGEKLPG